MYDAPDTESLLALFPARATRLRRAVADYEANDLRTRTRVSEVLTAAGYFAEWTLNGAGRYWLNVERQADHDWLVDLRDRKVETLADLRSMAMAVSEAGERAPTKATEIAYYRVSAIARQMRRPISVSTDASIGALLEEVTRLEQPSPLV